MQEDPNRKLFEFICGSCSTLLDPSSCQSLVRSYVPNNLVSEKRLLLMPAQCSLMVSGEMSRCLPCDQQDSFLILAETNKRTILNFGGQSSPSPRENADAIRKRSHAIINKWSRSKPVLALPLFRTSKRLKTLKSTAGPNVVNLIRSRSV